MDPKDLQIISNTYGLNNIPATSGGGFNGFNLFLGISFGIIGMAALKYGHKERNYRPVLIGLALIIFPYFVPNTVLLFIIGSLLSAGLYFWRE